MPRTPTDTDFKNKAFFIDSLLGNVQSVDNASSANDHVESNASANLEHFYQFYSQLRNQQQQNGSSGKLRSNTNSSSQNEDVDEEWKKEDYASTANNSLNEGLAEEDVDNEQVNQRLILKKLNKNTRSQRKK